MKDNAKTKSQLLSELAELQQRVLNLEFVEEAHRQVEQALRESEERFRSVVDNSPTGIFLVDNAYKFIYANDKLYRILAYSPEEIIGHDFREFLDDESRVLVADRYVRRQKGENIPPRYEFNIIRKDGEKRRVELSSTVITDLVGNIRTVGQILDVTEHKQAEEALWQANLVVEKSPVTLFRWKADKGWPVEWVSRNVIRFGYSPEELLSGTILYASIVHPEDLDRVSREVQEYSDRQIDQFPQEYRIITKDGKVRWIDDRTTIERDPDGQIKHYQGIVIDITERKRAEQVQAATYRISEAAQAAQDLYQLFASIHAIINELMPARNFYISLYDPSTDLFIIPYQADEYDPECPPYKPGKGLGAYVMRTGEPLLATPEVFEQLERSGEAEILFRRMVDWLGVPLKTQRGIIGVMAVQTYTEAERLGEADKDVLAFVSTQVAMVIERKQAEEALRQSEERYRAISELTSDYTFSARIDRDGNVKPDWFAGAFQQITGYTWEEFISHGSWPSIVYPDDVLHDQLDLKKLLANQPIVTELRILTQSGEVRWVQNYVRPVWNEQQERVTRLIGGVQDITERKRMEEALQLHAQELASLNILGQRVNATLSLDQVVQAAIERMVSSTQCDLVFFFLREGDRLVLQGLGSQTSPLIQIEVPVHRVGECLCGLAFRAGKPVFSSNIQTDSRCTWDECKKVDLHSFAALPLFSGDEIFGVLGLASLKERDFSEQETYLETMVNQIATACQNALLHKQVQLHADKLEQRVAERTAQLEAANKELEAFSYSVSHDLRAPLRAMDGYSRLLLEDYADKLDAEGQEHLHRVRASSQHMGQLIDDLLKLSRLTRQEMKRERVDLSALANEIVNGLRASDPERSVEILVADHLVVDADVRLLRVVLENLLDNAWKFTGRRPHAVIEFNTVMHGDEKAYFVRDNGAGFDMKYADKLFIAFQRLHSPSEFEGNGIGLATVQRIIRRHGGQVWAEAVEDQGATFYFTLGSDMP
jgi:PAS domain S-box-containing protein